MLFRNILAALLTTVGWSLLMLALLDASTLR